MSSIIIVIYASLLITRSEKQYQQAELERVKNVKNLLVSIVEDHIINSQSIDIPRISRLLELKKREDNVTSPISVLEIVENAEFNIINSKYLDYNQKKKYKEYFDSIYSDINSLQLNIYKDIPNADLINELSKNIQDGKSSEALKTLNRLVDSYNSQISKYSIADSKSKYSKMLNFISTDLSFVLFVIIYFTMFLFLITRKGVRLRLIRIIRMISRM